MKRIVLSIIFIFICVLINAQVPEYINYQAIVRDDGEVLSGQPVNYLFSIIKGELPGEVRYTEKHSTSTNQFGLVTLAIGNGTNKTGNFTTIDWGAGIYFLKVEIDLEGDGTYTDMGTTQLLSVPYAMYSKKAGAANETDPIFGAWDKSTGIIITALQVSDFQTNVTNNDAVLANTAKNSYPTADAAKLAAITGTNTGDQNLTSVLTKGTDAGNKQIVNISQQGIGTATPDASSALEISSTTQGFLPPRMTKAQRNEITPVEGLVIYNTTTKILNYYDGTVWRKFDGSQAVLDIGENYEGGIIAYILQPCDPGYVQGEVHGIIAAPSDQSTDAEWGCPGILTNANGVELGTGLYNTYNILGSCTTAGTAAKLCSDLTLNGFPDWYLPSKDELNKLFINKAAIGGFVEFPGYWSSTEEDEDNAFIQDFYDGASSHFPKEGYSGGCSVRAVRSF